MVRCLEKVSWHDGYHTGMVANLANFVLPVRFGEVLRLFLVKRTSNISFASSTAASLVEFFSFMFFILLFLTPITGFQFPAWVSKFTPIFFVFLIISAVIFIFGIRSSAFIKKWTQKILLLAGLEQDKVDSLLKGKLVFFFKGTLERCHISAFTKTNVLVILLISLMIICTDGFYFYFLMAAFNLPFKYFYAIIAACFMNVFFFVPSPPGKVGTAELYPILIFSGVFNLPSNIISTAAVLWHIIGILVITLLGAFSMFSLGLQVKTILNFSDDFKEDSLKELRK